MFVEKVRDARIMIVDDEMSNIRLMEDVLRVYGHDNVRGITDSRGFLAQFIEFQPDLVILDLMMPHVSGFQILNVLRYTSGDESYLPILVCTADNRLDSRCRALSSGAMDYIIKPFIADEIILRVNNLLRVRFQQIQLQQQNRVLEEVISQRTRELEDYQLELKEAQIEVIVRLARAAEHHDLDTAQHTQRVTLTSSLLAQSFDLPDSQINLLRRAAPLHDVGKIGVPDSVLLKPSGFTPTERSLMNAHCEIGADLLAGGHSDLVRVAERVALTHHERWDGSGYPHGLRGEEIDFEGRILAVADVFDALTHNRPYKPAWPLDKAINEIAYQSGRHFDPRVVDAFMSLPHAELL